MSASILRCVSKRSPVVFFGLTLLMSAPFMILGVIVRTPEGAVVDLPLSALQFVAPLLAAGILVARQDGWRSARHLLAGAIDIRRIRPARWAVPMVLIVPAIYVASYGLMRLAGRPLPDLEVSVASVLVLLALFLVTGFFEEIGWTGYALDPLRDRLGALGAALVIGVVWALFHLISDLQGGHDLGWIAWHRLASVMLRVLIVWVYLNAGNALAAAIVVHATDNVSWQTFPTGGSHYDPVFTAPVSVVVVAVVVFLWGPRTLARFRYARTPDRVPPVDGET